MNIEITEVDINYNIRPIVLSGRSKRFFLLNLYHISAEETSISLAQNLRKIDISIISVLNRNHRINFKNSMYRPALPSAVF